MMTYFTDVVNVGELYLERIFLKFENEPIIFLCSDNIKNLYLCVCTEIRYQQNWLIIAINKNQLKEMIKGNKNVRSAFVESEKIITINMDVNGKELSKMVSLKEINPMDLPSNNVYL